MRFADDMTFQVKLQRHHCGGGHDPTSAFEGRYLESPFQDICCAVHVSVNVPAASALIDPARLAIRGFDKATGVTHLRGVRLIDGGDGDAVLLGFVGDVLGQVGERPGVQALVEFSAVVDVVTDAAQIADGNLVDPGLVAAFDQILREDVQPMVDLAAFLTGDLGIALAHRLFWRGWLDFGAEFVPVAARAFEMPPVHQERLAVLKHSRHDLRLAQVEGDFTAAQRRYGVNVNHQMGGEPSTLVVGE